MVIRELAHTIIVSAARIILIAFLHTICARELNNDLIVGSIMVAQLRYHIP